MFFIVTFPDVDGKPAPLESKNVPKESEGSMPAIAVNDELVAGGQGPEVVKMADIVSGANPPELGDSANVLQTKSPTVGRPSSPVEHRQSPSTPLEAPEQPRITYRADSTSRDLPEQPNGSGPLAGERATSRLRRTLMSVRNKPPVQPYMNSLGNRNVPGISEKTNLVGGIPRQGLPEATTGQPVDFEPLVEAILQQHGLLFASTWHQSEKTANVTVTFTCAYPPDAEKVLKQLMDIGLGRGLGGSVTVLPIEIARPSANDIELDRLIQTQDQALSDPQQEAPISKPLARNSKKTPLTREEQRQLLFNTVKSTLAIERVLDRTKNEAKIGFDYVMMVGMAGIIAAIGLMTNNVVFIVASMLISPLMGPLLAWSFGTVIHDWRLFRLGIRSESIGVLVTIFIGFLCGLVGGYFVDNWPTTEMSERGTLENAMIGIAIALPSGVAVALSVLSNSVGALVGVAISASLLPPAVNSGLNLAFAIVGPLYKGSENTISPTQSLIIAGYSTLVAFLNILCIYVAAVLMFYLKEVAPIPGKSDFWNRDIPNTRLYVDTTSGKHASELTKAVRNLNMGDFEEIERMVALEEAGGGGGGGKVVGPGPGTGFRSVRSMNVGAMGSPLSGNGITYHTTGWDHRFGNSIIGGGGGGSGHGHSSHVPGGTDTHFSKVLTRLIATAKAEQSAPQANHKSHHYFHHFSTRHAHQATPSTRLEDLFSKPRNSLDDNKLSPRSGYEVAREEDESHAPCSGSGKGARHGSLLSRFSAGTGADKEKSTGSAREEALLDIRVDNGGGAGGRGGGGGGEDES